MITPLTSSDANNIQRLILAEMDGKAYVLMPADRGRFAWKSLYNFDTATPGGSFGTRRQAIDWAIDHKGSLCTANPFDVIGEAWRGTETAAADAADDDEPCAADEATAVLWGYCRGKVKYQLEPYRGKYMWLYLPEEIPVTGGESFDTIDAAEKFLTKAAPDVTLLRSPPAHSA